MSSPQPATSQELLRGLLSCADVPVLVFDSQGYLLEHSPAADRLLSGLLPGFKLAEQAAVEPWRTLAQLIAQCQHSPESPAQPQTTLLDRAGKPRCIQWKASKKTHGVPAQDFFYLLGQDQTDRFELEDELQKTTRLIRDHKMALDASAIVAMTDHRGLITYVNDTFCKISGYERSELIGFTHSVLKSGLHSPTFYQELWQNISQGKIWQGEICNRRKDSSLYWVDTTIVPFLNDSGRPYQYIAIRYDITDKKTMQVHLEQERLRFIHAEKMASLGEMAAGIAHELGNPAASINAWLDVIESHYEREMLNIEMFMQTLPKVRRDAQRIRDIIRSMLSYARDGSRDPLQTEGLQTIIGQAVEYCSYKLRKNGIVVRQSVSNPYLSLECRQTEMIQVLVNFILNACDAVHDLEDRWMEIEAMEEVNEQIQLSITDSGPGIPETIAARLFEPFFTTKPVGQGTGLGLSICHSIIEHHQGRISLDRSSPCTRFVIMLPRHQSSQKSRS